MRYKTRKIIRIKKKPYVMQDVNSLRQNTLYNHTHTHTHTHLTTEMEMHETKPDRNSRRNRKSNILV